MIWRKSAASSAGETSAAKNVLVIQLGGLGPFVLALAAAQRIREAHVGARITLLTTEATKELAEKAPYFDTVDADGKPTEPQAITKLIARIRSAKYDMIYDLEGSNRTNNYFQGMRPWPPKWSGPVAGASHAWYGSDPHLITDRIDTRGLQQPAESHVDPGCRADAASPDAGDVAALRFEIGMHDEKPVHALPEGA